MTAFASSTMARRCCEWYPSARSGSDDGMPTANHSCGCDLLWNRVVSMSNWLSSQGDFSFATRHHLCISANRMSLTCLLNVGAVIGTRAYEWQIVYHRAICARLAVLPAPWQARIATLS